MNNSKIKNKKKNGKINLFDEVIIDLPYFKKITLEQFGDFKDNPNNKMNTKHIIFLGYKSNDNNSFWFLATTTKERIHFNQVKISNNNSKNIYLNLNRLYKGNFDNINKGIIRENKFIYLYKNKIISNIKKENLEKLCNHTSIKIYREELIRRNKIKIENNI